MLASFQYKWGAGEFIWTGIAPSLFGVSTVLIHARIGLGWTHDSQRSPPSNIKPTTVRFSANMKGAFDEERMMETTSGFKSSGMLRGPRTPTKVYTMGA
jgi:hypothetical protein